MWAICKKEFFGYFNSFSSSFFILGYLLVIGFILFVNPSTNIFDFGYAHLDSFFYYSPWLLIVLCSALTMNSFSEEYQQETHIILSSLPLSATNIVIGKFLGYALILSCALLPTFIYPLAIQNLSSTGGLDRAATLTNFIGLWGLSLCFLSIGMFCSSLSKFNLKSLFGAIFINIFLYQGLHYLATQIFSTGILAFIIVQLSMFEHYKNIQFGLVLLSDLLYFIITIALFLYVTIIKWRTYEN
ncbi:MAG: hypothetical protein ORN85_04130 [Sediminibacterium sp.]|nr:hypothetical protein [Sediminibacterium sp.]